MRCHARIAHVSKPLARATVHGIRVVDGLKTIGDDDLCERVHAEIHGQPKLAYRNLYIFDCHYRFYQAVGLGSLRRRSAMHALPCFIACYWASEGCGAQDHPVPIDVRYNNGATIMVQQ